MAVRSTDGNSLFFATGIDNSGLKSGADGAVGIIQGLASGIGKINPFAALATFASTAFTTISAQAYQMSKNFEHAMKEVETISDATQKNFDGISQSVFNLSKITPDNPQKLANAYYQIVSAGYDGAAGLQLLETSAKAAVAGVTDTITAADGLTTILNAFQIDASESETVADALFNTVKLGKTNFSELASSISQVAPIAAASNIPLNQILSTIASLTKQGVPTAQATTQIRAAIVGLQKAGSLDGTKTFQQNMADLYKTVDGNQTTLLKEVGSIEAVQAILAVSGKNALSAAKDLETYNDTIGASEEAFNRMASSNINQWAILGNRIKATTKGIGDVVLEMSSSIAKGLNALLDTSKKTSDALKDEQLELATLEAEILDVNTSTEDRIKLINELKEKYPKLLSDIDAETVSNQQLEQAISKVNDRLIDKIALQIKDEELTEKATKASEKFVELDDAKRKLREQTLEAERKYGIEVDKNVSLLERAKAVQDELNKIARKNDGLGATGYSLDIDLSGELSEVVRLSKQYDELNTIADDFRKQRNDFAKSLGFDSNTLTDEVKKALSEINKITTDDYKKNENVLDQYLKSENEKIAKAANVRLDLIKKALNPNGGDNDTTFSESLKAKEKQYQQYNLALENNEKELAEKLKKQYKLNEQDYVTYLRKLYEHTKNTENKAAILSAIESQGADLKPRKTVETVSTLKIKGIVEDIEIDDTSINAIERQIQDLQEEFNGLTKSERDSIGKILHEKIKAKQKELDIANNVVTEEKNLYENLTRSLSSLNNKQLRDYIDYWKDRLKEAKEGSDEAKEAESNVYSASQEISQNVSDALSKISGILGEASSLFKKFGEEDTAQLLDQLAGVAEGVAQIATGNPLDIIQGSLKVLNSALTVEVVSDTAKFEAAIKELEKAISKLDYVISKSIGQDKISSRKEAIDDLKELEEQAQKAKEAELNARKEVKLLGLTIGKKGKGSGTDPAKLEELEQKAEDARRKAEELKQQLDELYTGTTANTIVDSIISGLKEGKRSVADFADNFKDLMQNAMLEAFEIKYLEKEIGKFYDAFSDAGSDSEYTSSEIASLRSLYNSIISGAQSDIEAINDVLGGLGIDPLGSSTQPKQGLSGAIENITADQAELLSGQVNSIILDIRQGLFYAQQSLEYLKQIQQNTSYNRYLESMDNRLNNIETLLS